MPGVLVTGASRGIGLEFTRQYAEEGWETIACCRNPDKADGLKALAAKHKTVRVEALDVDDGASIAALAAKLKYAAMDLLINNAGIARGKAARPGDNYNNPEQTYGTLDAAAWMDILRTNAVAPIMVTEAFTPHVTRSKQRKIVMISSRYGSIALNFPELMAYSASKAALNMAMRKVALALKPQKAVVASLHPGWVKTDMGGPNARVSSEESVRGMRRVIENLELEQTGLFFGYDGEAIPW